MLGLQQHKNRELFQRALRWGFLFYLKGEDMRDKTSLLHWYPMIKHLDIPQPKTEWTVLSKDEYRETFEGMPDSLLERVMDLIKSKFNIPVFIRTDLSSAKHFWKDTCYYDGSEGLREHLFSICEFNHCADMMGLLFKAIVIREYIEMESKYTAFENMPVNPERRYFIKDGKVVCHHSYWIKEAIRRPSVDNWEALSDEMNLETPDEIELLTNYSEKVARVIKDGFWSIDFCKAKDGRWILIDMAVGERSWHPKCEHDND